MRRIAVVNLKGGSAKTTTAISLAVAMAARGLRVLLVDADAQGNATLTMTDGRGAEGPTLGDVLLGRSTADEAIRPTRAGGLSILPADARLADAALHLADAIGREHRFRRSVEPVADRFDVMIVDCPPQLSLVSVNVLAGVDELVVPVDAGIYSVAGLAQLQGAVDQVREYLSNASLRLAGLVITKAHRNRATSDIEAQLRDAYGSLVYRATVPHSVKVEEAHARNLTILEYAPGSAPAKAYANLATEILDDGQPVEQPGDTEPADGPDEADDDAPAPAARRRGRRAS